MIAALPMYDWPECRAEVDAQWASVRDRLRAKGIAAPEQLTRRNGDMPPVPGGIRDAAGAVIAPDPASLPPDELDLFTLWRHPDLIYAQTCRGPLEHGLAAHVQVIGEPDYDGVVGGQGGLYSSALVMRRDGLLADVLPADDGTPLLPLSRLTGQRLAFNDAHSMSGLLGLERDLAGLGRDLSLFSAQVLSGSHRRSLVMVARGQADVAAIDARSWAMAQRFEPAASELAVVGWTGLRPGLPFVCAARLGFLFGA